MYFSLWLHMELILLGISDFRHALISAEIAEKGQFPYIVYVKLQIHDEINSCGGGILDETHIITAAHCVANYHLGKLAVIVNEIIVLDWNVEDDREVINVAIHPKYELGQCISDFSFCWRSILPFVSPPEHIKTNKNDIAILTLKNPLLLGKHMKKLEIMNCNFLPYHYECEFAGWGEINTSSAVSQLRGTTFVILTPQECKNLGIFHRDDEFCAKDPREKSTVLNGDSGGPLVCGGNLLFGIVVRSYCKPQYPAVFINVFEHRKFISEALKK